jgi:hypothetical protein
MENYELTEVNEDEVEETEEEEETKKRSGIGIGMLIGSGLTVAAIAVSKKARKMWQDHKAKKEAAAVTIIDADGKVVPETEQPEPKAEEPEEDQK